jgi:phage gp29-like protein
MVTTSRILGPDGRPIQLAEIREPQTAHLTSLHHEVGNHPSRGLTPSKLAAILDAAEQGDIIGQYELFEDMEEKDGHIMSEMGKRRRAVLGLDWDIVPPDGASAKEKKAAKTLMDLMQGLDDFEATLFDVTDAIGKGFASLEYDGWHRIDGDWLPRDVIHRPQSWFQLVRGQKQELRLRGGMGGEPLRPFGWIVHTHKAKSGYLERSALFRVLVWPYLFKNYSVGDLAEFLEIYGIPMRVGKYPSGATEKEKLTLLRALAALGHNAAGIIPIGMELEFLNAAQGDPAAFELMIAWCERTQSKAILGGTLTSQADGKSSTNALGNVHNEVRQELRDADALQIAKTLSRDLIYPIAVLNGLVDDWRRCPRFKFITEEPEDLVAYAESLPKLLGMGFRIDRQWAQEKVGIPEPESDADLLTAPGKAVEVPADAEPVGQQAAATAQTSAPSPAVARLDDDLQPITGEWIAQIRTLVETAQSLEEIRDRLVELLPDMTIDQYAEAMAQALAAAALQGRYDIVQEAAGGR